MAPLDKRVLVAIVSAVVCFVSFPTLYVLSREQSAWLRAAVGIFACVTYYALVRWSSDLGGDAVNKALWRGADQELLRILHAMVPPEEEPKVLIIGGTGKIGSTCAFVMLELHPRMHVYIAGRNRQSGERIVAELGSRCSFVPVDLNDPDGLRESMAGKSLVLHTAGPFKDLAPTALEAAIDVGVPYVDIADTWEYASAAKDLHSRAEAAGIPAVTTGGIFPGVDNMMAAAMVGEVCGASEGSQRDAGSSVKSVRIEAFCAGTGGCGPAVMHSTLFMGATPCTYYVGGKAQSTTCFSPMRRHVASFAEPVGARAVYPFALPEVITLHRVFGVGKVESKFGAAPDACNWIMWLQLVLTPRWVNSSRRFCNWYIWLITPFLVMSDVIAGGALALNVEVCSHAGERKVMRLVHPSVVLCTAYTAVAFSWFILAHRVQPGVWYPEESLRGAEALEEFLHIATYGADALEGFGSGPGGRVRQAKRGKSGGERSPLVPAAPEANMLGVPS